MTCLNTRNLSVPLLLLLISQQATGFAPSHAAATRTTHAAQRIAPLQYISEAYDDVEYKPKKRKYKLHSNRVSELTSSSTADDVLVALKRCQNTKNGDDLVTIAEFLFRGVDDSFAYGYKGSLLARLAVAALRLDNYDVAQQAIHQRQTRFPDSLVPFESAAILRGLLRMHKIEEAFQLLEEELSVVSEHNDDEQLKHRALSLASIASRHFFEDEPQVAIQACQMLVELGPVIQSANLSPEYLDMPWYRILAGADQCIMANKNKNHPSDKHTCPYDEIVVNAIQAFPHGDEFQQVLE